MKKIIEKTALMLSIVLGLIFIVATGDSNKSSSSKGPSLDIPEITIINPEADSSFKEGESIHFIADIRGETTSIDWISSIDGSIGSDKVFTKQNLSPGEHKISLIAYNDSERDIKNFTLFIEKNRPSTEAPEISILTPETGSSFEEEEGINLTASGAIGKEGLLSGNSLEWRSSQEGFLGSGNTLKDVKLKKVGVHTISLNARDIDGAESSASIDITIRPANTPAPEISIIQPLDGSRFNYGDLINFYGEALDAKEGKLKGNQLTWTSSKDKQIGTGLDVQTDRLSMGTHKISLNAKNSSGIPGIPESISIHIENSPPVAKILFPETLYTTKLHTPILFIGKAEDNEDGLLPSESLHWNSSLDGYLGYGRNFTANNLRVGEHIISFIARDKDGGVDIDRIKVIVQN